MNQGGAISDRPDHEKPMKSALLTSLASHGHRRTDSAAPWGATLLIRIACNRILKGIGLKAGLHTSPKALYPNVCSPSFRRTLDSLPQRRPKAASGSPDRQTRAVHAGQGRFCENADGKLTQYELPTKFYHRDGRNWRVNLFSQRWRKEGAKGWLEWRRFRYDRWNSPGFSGVSPVSLAHLSGCESKKFPNPGWSSLSLLDPGLTSVILSG